MINYHSQSSFVGALGVSDEYDLPLSSEVSARESELIINQAASDLRLTTSSDVISKLRNY
jgi:hypothetical protein